MTLPVKDKLIINFNRCANWEEKYLYIIELGQKISIKSKNLYLPENLINGCQSQVWIKVNIQPDNTILFEGDSDSVIVKGLIAIVFILFQNLSVSDIMVLDVKYWFHKLSLMRHITPTRSRGIEAVVKSIRYKINILSKN
ncbi:cysteine desulfuration protein SufE [Candidatus Pantoea edessiphila]|uniref:Cysteine desulfuration protein SufE n=1 Tax=Candidatus Pantoea edessiphila TaxID=2044610 RepID=A0A2P5SYW2_9GAMM|nr:cysteine desulfuration protein SufE [Candidatus Pantoea edessiphila]MBK4775390.1 cysteine desulfuration protein SufE [Pantoea sp. Edef]PPI87480.1 cysteine desulfuration protein SufE [Candidatus Pantoea edessiphila]